MFTLSLVKERLQQLGVNPKKALGQNFLVNDSTCERIVRAVSLLEPTALIEIGPGLGALTDKLELLHLPIQLIELDRAFSGYWRERGLPLIEADALKVDWKTLGLLPGTVLVSNLPYQISASLVIDRSVDPEGISGMVLMFQKEVAQRIVATPRTENYGLLSVMAQSFWDCQFLLEAGPKDFFPPPSVASRVLTFRRRRQSEIENAKDYLVFVKAAFSQRRKMLVKNLMSWHGGVASVIGPAFAALGIDMQARAEELAPDLFQKLYVEIKRKLS